VRAFKAGLVELLLLGALGVVVGFGVNATRSRGAIKPTKNYFAIGPAKPAAKKATNGGVAATTQTGESSADAQVAEAGSDGGADQDAKSSGGDAQTEESPYPVLSPDEVIEIYNDPQTASGLNVFVDARNDQAFEEGHIPGAIQFFPYEADRFIDDVMERTNGVLRIIVYCNGGECTDSKYACRELLEMGLPEDAVFLFAEGWEAWTAKNMPVAEGRDDE